MFRFLSFFVLTLFVSLVSLYILVPVQAEDLLDVRDAPTEPVPVIFDTDIGGDIDDALALGILHIMADRGKCKLLAVSISRSRGNSADYVRAHNLVFGHPDVAIAWDPNCPLNSTKGSYSDQTLALKNPDGSPCYPVTPYTCENPLRLHRKLLAEAKDHSIVWIQVGEATNAAALLESGPDDISPLSGRELAAKKVRLLSVMGGAFGFTDPKYAKHREYNVIMDLPSAKKVCADWPGEVVFSGYETGDTIHVSVCGVDNDLLQPSPNLLRDSYTAWCVANRQPLTHARPCWDLTSVLFVLRPEKGRDYYTLSEPGKVTVQEDGITTFTPCENGRHRVFLTSPDQKIRVQEAFVNLIYVPIREK